VLNYTKKYITLINNKNLNHTLSVINNIILLIYDSDGITGCERNFDYYCMSLMPYFWLSRCCLPTYNWRRRRRRKSINALRKNDSAQGSITDNSTVRRRCRKVADAPMKTSPGRRRQLGALTSSISTAKNL